MPWQVNFELDNIGFAEQVPQMYLPGEEAGCDFGNSWSGSSGVDKALDVLHPPVAFGPAFPLG